MGSSLKTYTVEELVNLGALEKPLDGNHGGIHPKSSEFVAEGIPFIMASDMKNGKIDTRNCKFISEDQARGLRKGFAKEGDVLLSHKATIGRTAIVDNIDTAFIVLTPQVTYYRVKNLGVINPKYLKYYFDSVQFQSLFEQWAGGGSTRLYLGITGQKKLPIELPDIETQNSIASIISDYDLKLLLNRQTNQTLEQMAQALFKSWFVDFDPVFDNLLASVDFKLENLETSLPDELKQKAQRRLAALNSLENATECKASLIALAHELQAQTQAAVQVSEKAAETPVKANPTILAQHANTHAHFPNEFEHNEQLGWIPKGWEVKTINELCKINPESWTKKNAPKVVKYVDLANAKNGAVGEAIEYSFSEAPSRARRVLRPHDTIIGVVRPANRSFAYVNEENLTGSTGFAVVRANNQNCRAFAYFSLTNDDCIQEFTRIADGAAYPAIKPEDVAKTYCLFSNNKILDAFESIVGEFMTKVAKNEQQNRYLTKLRDTLLPKLISGELQIPDVATDDETVD
ncbi:restriction endonuclease subunit S [Pseudoalteromonas sp. BSi20495]|uniref:restriction endonuclease subunit S n=1 Tax=Pseudoalteromonas sp. BSi20495 TaxID=386429 RepID=UPI0002315E24|nr:restriction endonuclease subunit S [Pseudoalteromonas sp. BSi20495]GAA81790.1 type I restriction enzyme, S subunit [Pseudoalteromonas sp. BSi20495]